MGRSRGGLTTKIHALVDAEGRPIKLELTAGQTHDSQPAPDMLEDMQEGAILLADKAYDSDAIRQLAQNKKAWANIPPKSNRKKSFAFSQFLYRYRNMVERFFNKLKQFRGIATRYDKKPENFLAAVKLASVRIWMRSL
jgi:transposase